MRSDAVREEWDYRSCETIIQANHSMFIESKSIREGYINTTEIDDGDENMLWCKYSEEKYGVIPGKTWGKIRSANLRNAWNARECDILLKTGISLSCSETTGLLFIQRWRDNTTLSCPEVSQQEPWNICRKSVSDNLLCSFNNLAIDPGM